MTTESNEQYRAGFEAWFEAEYPKDEEGNRTKYRNTMVMDLMRSAWEGGKREASTVVRAGAVRPGFGEAPPRLERRRFPESGME